MLSDNWNISSVACSDFVGDNAPLTAVDLRHYFHEVCVMINNFSQIFQILLQVNQSFTYSPITFKKSPQDTFKGLKGLMAFTMHISAVNIIDGEIVESVLLGTWLAGMNGKLNVSNEKRFDGMKAIKILRVASVLVRNVVERTNSKS
jgi:hypothetical protein